MEYFFGYYDKSPWDATDRYILCLRAKDTQSSVAPKEPAEIILFDTHNNNTYKVLGKQILGMFNKDVCFSGWDPIIRKESSIMILEMENIVL